jgi:hypothetical protein
MALILEDGTGPAGANAYATEAMCDTYCDTRAITDWTSNTTGDKEAALIRGSIGIDGLYRARFPGYRTYFRAQGLEWPRTMAYDAEGILVPGNAVPQEIIDAACEAAVRELVAPGSMIPDLERGGGILRLQAGSVAIDYGAASTPYTTFGVIDGIVAKLLSPMSPYSSRTARG